MGRASRLLAEVRERAVGLVGETKRATIRSGRRSNRSRGDRVSTEAPINRVPDADVTAVRGDDAEPSPCTRKPSLLEAVEVQRKIAGLGVLVKGP
jgi:hypothetical protein